MFVGAIRCPNCESNIDSEVMVCPYCQTTAPMRGEWKARGPWNWMLGGAILLIAGLDRVYNLNLWQRLCDFFK